MPEIARRNTEAAKEQPERQFASPQELVDEVLLTRGQKLAALERWKAKVLHEMTAADDGMATRGVSIKHNALLVEIDDAIVQLRRVDG